MMLLRTHLVFIHPRAWFNLLFAVPGKPLMVIN